jgi:integrase
MERFSTFLRWASNNGFLDAALADQAAELARGRDDVVGGAHAFDLPRLKRIFDSDQYLSDSFPRAYQYWGPLIALFTAARIAEIANLSVDDFVEVDGIACIWFRGTALEFNGKTYERRVKTDAADRRVPLHPTLIALGLLDYVAARRTAGAVLLFDGLTYSTKSQFSRNLGNWAQHYLKDVGVHEHRRFVFHSFRSTLGQQLDGKLRDVLIDRLVGHRGKTIRERFYNTGADGTAAMPAAEVYAALSQVDFGLTFHPTRRWSGQSWSQGRST